VTSPAAVCRVDNRPGPSYHFLRRARRGGGMKVGPMVLLYPDRAPSRPHEGTMAPRPTPGFPGVCLPGRSRSASLPLLISLFLVLEAIAAGATSAAGPDDDSMTLRQVQQMIETNGYSWTAAHTSVSDIPWAEFKQRLGFNPPPGFENRPKVDLAPGAPGSKLRAVDLPARWDWREHEGITPVKDQGGCGSCWAFCSIGALEGCARIDDHLIYDLSEQQMLDCNTHGEGCAGGSMSSCYEIFQTYGAVAEEAIPYHASGGVQCFQEEFEPLAKISSWFYIEETVESIKAGIYTYGPIAAGMTVFPDFMSYSGGCYEHPSGGDLNHGIVILGWDDDYCGGSWICKNSWGTGWGDAGFFYLRYGKSDIGALAAVIVHRPRVILKIDHDPPETTTRTVSPFKIEAEITSNLAAINPDSVTLSCRVNGGEFVALRMHPAGRPDTYHAEIPVMPRPTEVDYYIRAVDLQDNKACRPADAPDSLYSFDIAYKYDPFEADSTGWTVGAEDDDATSGIWERVAPLATVAQPGRDRSCRGSRCWVTGQQIEGAETGANDVDGGKTTLISPRFELYKAGTASVKFARWYSNDRGAAPNEDVWLVQARNNYGPWVDVERTTQSSNAWVVVEADLLQLLGPDLGEVQFRFVASDEGRGSNVEAAIDDFVLLADPDTTVVSWASRGAGFRVSQAWPNPTNAETRIRLQIDEETSGTAKIYAPDGRFVATLFRGELDPRRHELVWDGRDDGGRLVPSGVYYCLMEIGGETVRTPFVIVR
jgi:C1A family cysteine protease